VNRNGAESHLSAEELTCLVSDSCRRVGFSKVIYHGGISFDTERTKILFELR
jgi:hypothetical protein